MPDVERCRREQRFLSHASKKQLPLSTAGSEKGNHVSDYDHRVSTLAHADIDRMYREDQDEPITHAGRVASNFRIAGRYRA